MGLVCVFTTAFLELLLCHQSCFLQTLFPETCPAIEGEEGLAGIPRVLGSWRIGASIPSKESLSQFQLSDRAASVVTCGV